MPSLDISCLPLLANQDISIANENTFYVIKVELQQVDRGLVLTVSTGKAARKKQSPNMVKKRANK